MEHSNHSATLLILTSNDHKDFSGTTLDFLDFQHITIPYPNISFILCGSITKSGSVLPFYYFTCKTWPMFLRFFNLICIQSEISYFLINYKQSYYL